MSDGATLTGLAPSRNRGLKSNSGPLAIRRRGLIPMPFSGAILATRHRLDGPRSICSATIARRLIVGSLPEDTYYAPPLSCVMPRAK